ncbi:ABC transporter substrate-binding protein [Konateibacter massiliensis]|uniref:ABC transporter substrate-binding protein n=1 Tax=Konateibacter massiliensis TaxID=2002841 RepID=UPI000C156D1A|nr:ABC transporter substrate-binding protein [Konateibacter massiliensis]
MKKLNKKFLLPLMVMAVLLVTVGCQGANTSETAAVAETEATAETTKDSQAEATEEAQDVQEESGTRTVSTVMGDIEVPANPQRVVVNWYIGDVLALDLNVVGYNAWAHEAMPFYDKMMATTGIENWEQEEVMALDPDLIITYSQDDYNTFNSIAPVLVVPEEGMTSLERVLFIGEATGRSEQAQAAVDTFNTKLDAAKETLEGDDFKGKTFSINEDWGSASYGVYYETGSRGGTLLYEYLGLQKPEKLEQLVEETGEGRGGLSYEVAAEYFGDYMIWFRPYDAVEDNPSEYELTPIWESLPAVQAGQVVTVPGNMSGLFYYSDVLSVTAQLDYIIDKLNEVVK